MLHTPIFTLICRAIGPAQPYATFKSRYLYLKWITQTKTYYGRLWDVGGRINECNGELTHGQMDRLMCEFTDEGSNAKAKAKDKATRPDTRPPVADGWGGVVMRRFPTF